MGKRYSVAEAKAVTRIVAGDGFDEWFDVVSRPTTGMVMDAADSASNGERGLRLALAFVTAWSLVDDASATLPLTIGNMRMLPIEMIQPLMEHVKKVMSFLPTAQT